MPNENLEVKRGWPVIVVASLFAIILVVIAVVFLVNRSKNRSEVQVTGSNIPATTDIAGTGQPATSTVQDEGGEGVVPSLAASAVDGETNNDSANFYPEFSESTDRLLADSEKVALGYPVEWSVRLRASTDEKSGKTYPIYVVEDKPTDQDEDGLSDVKEKSLGTDVGNSDTDDDGVGDGAEVDVYKTSPIKADTDGDGVDDGDELEIKSDPLTAD